MMLPNKKNFNWAYIFFVTFNLNFLVLIFSRVGIGATLDSGNTMLFVFLSLSVAFFVSLGYFGLKLFTIEFMIGNLISLVTISYICYSNATEGWVDLTTLMTYILINVFSLFLGFLIEVISRIIKSKKEEKIEMLEESKKTRRKEEQNGKREKSGPKSKKTGNKRKKSNKRGSSKHRRK